MNRITKFVDLPVHINTKTKIKELKKDLTYDEFIRKLFGWPKLKPYKHTEISIQKMRVAKLGKKRPPFSEQWKNKMKLARKNRKIPYRDTIPEKMLQTALKLKQINFETHKTIKLPKSNSFHQTDIITKRFCIEVDGCYWHGCPKCFPDRTKLNNTQLKTIDRDNIVNHELNELGYHVIRIWEHSIKENNIEIANNIIKLIQTPIIHTNNLISKVMA